MSPVVQLTWKSRWPYKSLTRWCHSQLTRSQEGLAFVMLMSGLCLYREVGIEGEGISCSIWVQAGTSGIFLFLERNLNEGDLDFCRLTVVPDLFGTRDPLHGRQFFHEPAWWGGGGRWLGWFKPITLNMHSTSVFITSAPPQIIRHWILDDLVSNISMHHL